MQRVPGVAIVVLTELVRKSGAGSWKLEAGSYRLSSTDRKGHYEHSSSRDARIRRRREGGP